MPDTSNIQEHPSETEKLLGSVHKSICQAGFIIVMMIVTRRASRSSIRNALSFLRMAIEQLEPLSGDSSGRPADRSS